MISKDTKKNISFLNIIVLISGCILSATSHAELGLNLTIESGPVFESRNEARIPGDTGTRFDLKGASGTPAAPLGLRAYVSYKVHPQHEIRALYAPLVLNGSIKADSEIKFRDQTFSSGSTIQTLYKFNSYRLSYIYHPMINGPWDIGFGLTAKIRDAEIRLSRLNTQGSKSNIGFVPLVHFQAKRTINETWSLKTDIDALGAPQGRAIDLALLAERYLTSFGAGHAIYGYTGYRTVEGGADNDTVYNFAWFHSFVFGLRGSF
jgi:hypothetical protein